MVWKLYLLRVNKKHGDIHMNVKTAWYHSIFYVQLRQYVPVLIRFGKTYLPIDHILCKSNLKCKIAQNFDNGAKCCENISAWRVCELLQGGHFSPSNCMRGRTLVRKLNTIPVRIMTILYDSKTIYPGTVFRKLHAVDEALN